MYICNRNRVVASGDAATAVRLLCTCAVRINGRQELLSWWHAEVFAWTTVRMTFNYFGSVV